MQGEKKHLKNNMPRAQISVIGAERFLNRHGLVVHEGVKIH